MLYKIGVLKSFARFTGNTTVLESIFKYILRFILESILKVSSCEFCEIFKRTFFTEQLWTTASAVVLLIFYIIIIIIIITLFSVDFHITITI